LEWIAYAKTTWGNVEIVFEALCEIS
jgi:hypothetical protein